MLLTSQVVRRPYAELRPDCSITEYRAEICFFVVTQGLRPDLESLWLFFDEVTEVKNILHDTTDNKNII